MPNPPPTILITGASGYIGARLVALLANRGYRVHALMREPATSFHHPAVRTYRYDLNSALNIDAFTGVVAVVHTAASTKATQSLSEDVEIDAARRLVKQARSFGVRKIVFVSSLAARSDASHRYVRVKRAIETIILAEATGCVVRPGLVYGGCDRGLFGALSLIAKRAPCIPVFFPSPSVQPIHIDDLVHAILNILEQTGRTLSVYNLARSEQVSIGSFLRSVAWYRHRRYPLAVPVPLGLVKLLIWVGRAVSFLPEYYLERLRGLVALQSQTPDGEIHCREAGIAPRSLSDGLLNGHSGRRHLLEEGRALIYYVARPVPCRSGLRRYTRAMERTRQGRSLSLPPLYLRFPWTLRLVDPKSPVYELAKNVRDELEGRLDFVVALAEATPLSASRFHLRRPQFILGTAVSLTVHLVPELILTAFAKVLRVFRRPPQMRGTKDAR